MRLEEIQRLSKTEVATFVKRNMKSKMGSAPSFEIQGDTVVFDRSRLFFSPQKVPYEPLKVPFKMTSSTGIDDLTIIKRTIENWSDIPVDGIDWINLEDCKLPPLDQMPHYNDIWIGAMKSNFNDSIMGLMSRPARADRVIFSLRDGGDLLIEITKHFNEDTLDLQQYSPEPLRITFTNPFELQDWLIENGYEYLV